MLHDNKPVPADNGGSFLSEDVEMILADYYDKYINENGAQVRRFEKYEILEMYSISEAELDRMKHRLSYEYVHGKEVQNA